MYTSKDKVKKKKRKHSDSDSSNSDDDLAISAPLPKKVQTHQRWSTKDYHILLERVEKEIPPDDKASYSTRNHKLNWDEIAFGDYTSEECKKTWFFLTAKIRKYRLLEEIATDVRHWINKNGLDPRNHPDYPRRPLNAYFFMCQDKRPELLEEFPDSTNQEIAKKCGRIYRHLSPKELEKYSKLSRKDSAKIKLQIKQFYKQHPEYNKFVDKDASDRKPRKPFEIFLDYEQENNPNYTNRDGALQTWSEMLDEDRLFWINWAVDEFNKYKEAHKEARNVVLSKQEKEIMAKFTGQPEKPPLTAFHLFIKMMSKSEEFKALNHREKMGTIANIWKNSSDEDQEQYRIRLKQMRERYEKEFYEYLQTLSPANRLKVWTRANMMRSKPNKSNVKNDEPVKIKSAVKKTKTELIGPRDEPKAPPSSCYRFFLKNWRGEEDPKIAWGRLGDSEKVRWEEKWTESKKEFIANYELYLRTLSRRELENLAKSGNVLLAKNKDEGGANPNLNVALAALQRKKKLERELQRLDGALTTLETQRDILETANTNSVVLSSLSDASGAIKAAHKHMNADKIDELMDDLVGQKELSDEISNAIGNPVGFNDDIDEDELEAELAELELDDLEEFSTLPTVPTDELRTPKRQVPQKILTIAS